MNPKVLVATPCSEYPSRCDAFYDCFYNLILPEGSERRRIISNDPSANMNLAVRIAQENNYTHIFFIDDDQMFAPDILLNLLKHDLDVVIGLYLMRKFPFRAVVFDDVLPDGQVHFMTLKKNGLIPIKAMGMGGVLIKTSVFDQLTPPYFGIRDGLGDDIQFSRALRNAGFQLYCDTTQIIWHAVRGSIAPVFQNGVWKTIVRIGELNLEIATADDHVLVPEPVYK